MALRHPFLQRKCACGGTPGANGECEECRKEKLQRKSQAPGIKTRKEGIAPPIVHEVLRSPGRPLDAATRAFMEPRFGHDFSQVRVHSDSKAAESAWAVSALAYTVGTQVVFGPGQYRPGTESGDNLLAHELAHTIQQGSETGGASAPLEVMDPADATERAADRSADAAMRGTGRVGAGSAPRGGAAVARLLPEEPVPVNDHADGAAKAPAAQAAPPQQGPAAPAAGGPAAQAAKPEEIIRQWLDKHQFAPPATQPENIQAERHVLLNGEDMTISDAVKLAAAGITPSQPPELIRSVISVALDPPDPRALPFIGPGNNILGIDLDKPRDAFGISPQIAKGLDFTTIDDFLTAHGFAKLKNPDPAGDHVLFDGKEITIEQVADLALAALGSYPSLKKPEVLTYIRQKYVAALGGLSITTIDDFLSAHNFSPPEIRDPTGERVLFDGKETTVNDVSDRALAIPGLDPSLKKPDVLTYVRQKYAEARGVASNQIVFGCTLIPKFSQIVGGPVDPLNPLRTQYQFSATFTRQHHAADSPGLESSFQASVSLNDKGEVSALQVGPQEAIVKPLLRGWIQVSGLAQIMAGANWSKAASGNMTISPAVQAAAGGQILVTPTLRSGSYKFINGHAQLGLQVLGGVQSSQSGAVGVLNAGLVLNIPF